jgi:hypothetical protein
MASKSTGRKTLEIKELFLETSKRFAGWTMLVAVDENGDEWILEGDYCGGIPVSSWHKVSESKSVKANSELTQPKEVA